MDCYRTRRTATDGACRRKAFPRSRLVCRWRRAEHTSNCILKAYSHFIIQCARQLLRPALGADGTPASEKRPRPGDSEPLAASARRERRRQGRPAREPRVPPLLQTGTPVSATLREAAWLAAVCMLTGQGYSSLKPMRPKNPPRAGVAPRPSTDLRTGRAFPVRHRQGCRSDRGAGRAGGSQSRASHHRCLSLSLSGTIKICILKTLPEAGQYRKQSQRSITHAA